MNTAPLILFFKAEQFGLFNAPVTVQGHTRNGKFVAPYTGVRRHKLQKPNHPISGHLFAQAPATVTSSPVPPEAAQPPMDSIARQAAVRKEVHRLFKEEPVKLKPLDHGELNIPGRTQKINAEIDRYQKQQKKAAKEEAKVNTAERKTDKAKAKEQLAQHKDEIIEQWGEKFGRKSLQETLEQWAKWEPKKLLNFIEKFKKEQAAPKVQPEPAPRTYRTPQARALAEAMQQGDLRAALAVLQPLSFKDAHDTALYAGLAVSNAQSKAQLLTQLQEQLLAASKKKTDGYGLHTKAFPARARMLFFKAAA